jgi:transcriptional regulator with XRE-family HTH domain
MNIVDIRQPEFGKRLKELRVQRGLSQRQVADSVVNPSYVSLLETGVRIPTLDVVVHIARMLQVAVGDLVQDGDIASGASSEQDRGSLLSFILTRSSIDFGNLEDARRRVAGAYAEAVDSQTPRMILEHGIVLQDMLEAETEHEQRYLLLGELIEVASGARLPDVLLKLQIDKAAAARDSWRLPEALSLASAAVEGIDETGLSGTSEHVRALGVLISVRCDAGEFDEVPRLIERMIAIAENVRSPALLGRAYWVASVAYGRIGDTAHVVDHVRRAREMLTNPATPLRVWGRFARAAANALLDAQVGFEEVERYLSGARSAFELLDDPGENEQYRLVEARYALATGDPAKAVALTEGTPAHLGIAQLISFRRTRGLALHQSGASLQEATEELAAAAKVAEEGSAFRSAAQLWREVANLRG